MTLKLQAPGEGTGKVGPFFYPATNFFFAINHKEKGGWGPTLADNKPNQPAAVSAHAPRWGLHWQLNSHKCRETGDSCSFQRGAGHPRTNRLLGVDTQTQEKLKSPIAISGFPVWPSLLMEFASLANKLNCCFAFLCLSVV